jgi:hypothetical protein
MGSGGHGRWACVRGGSSLGVPPADRGGHGIASDLLLGLNGGGLGLRSHQSRWSMEPSGRVGLADPWGKETHAATRYSWMRPPNTSRRRTFAVAQVTHRWRRVLDRRSKIEPTMRPSLVVMGDVGPEDPLEVSSAKDQGPVEALGADRAHPSFAERVGVRGPDRGEDDPHGLRAEHLVERPGELGVSVWIRNLGENPSSRTLFTPSDRSLPPLGSRAA